MIISGFTKDMRDILSDIKGKIFVSYECVKEGRFPLVYGNLRIYLDDYAIDLENAGQLFPFFNESEEMTQFSCYKVSKSTHFQPFVIAKTQLYHVDERITGVEILNDLIDVNDGEYIVSSDVALIIRTEKSIHMFARDVWFSEVINIANDDDYEKVFSTMDIIESWSDEGENKVKIKRSKTVF